MRHDVTVDLTNCDREPIHIPGSVQPHGCLLALDAVGQTILRHSTNVGDILGVAGEINGRRLDELLGGHAAHQLRNAFAMSNDPSRPTLLFNLDVGGASFDVAVHRHLSSAIIEFEPAPEPGRPLQLARDLVGRISATTTIRDLVTQTARLVHGMLGYDRVMIYQFEHDGAGKVLAEAKRGDLESFLGQYFPASDIPKQARALYLQNTIRIISDASGQRVRLEPELDASGEPLDLSFAHLRSVSPIHLEYLRNMGVSASMSISIVSGGELWGLIACHHYSPRVLAMSERVAAELFGRFFSLHLEALQHREKVDVANRARHGLDRFLRLASFAVNVDELLQENLDEFSKLLPCDGIGLWIGGRWASVGSAPGDEDAYTLVRSILGRGEPKIWATHALSQQLPQAQSYAEKVSGVLSVPLSQKPRDFLLFFRKELVQTLDWAGNPEKSYQTGPLGDRLTPRTSFAIWKETVHQQAQPWTDADRETAEAIRGTIVEVVLRHNEQMSEERAKADVRQRMLNEELNHRVKNILAVIKSLVGHPIQDGRVLEDYVAALKGRIQALSHAHDQVVRGEGGGSLEQLLSAELTPYRGRSVEVAFSGPSVWLDSRAYSVLALVLHELATNAAKYGALSRSGGNLSVNWSLDEAGCEIRWVETGGPKVLMPSRSGFGSALVSRSIPFDLGGSSKVEFHPRGLVATLRVPTAHLSSAIQPETARPDAAQEGTSGLPAALLANPPVLVVEDQMLIAMDLEGMLEQLGLTDVTTANSSADALIKLKRLSPAIAILDVNLGQETSIPVAHALKKRGIPFTFATGYGDSTVVPEEFSGVPVVRKPYDAHQIARALRDVMQ
jgi:light-regulated signal transduction histidine kinase (bacteriophytochrome)